MIIARLRARDENGRKFLQGRLTVNHRFREGTTVSLHKRTDGSYELIEWAHRSETNTILANHPLAAVLAAARCFADHGAWFLNH